MGSFSSRAKNAAKPIPNRRHTNGKKVLERPKLTWKRQYSYPLTTLDYAQKTYFLRFTLNVSLQFILDRIAELNSFYCSTLPHFQESLVESIIKWTVLGHWNGYTASGTERMTFMNRKQLPYQGHKIVSYFGLFASIIEQGYSGRFIIGSRLENVKTLPSEINWTNSSVPPGKSCNLLAFFNFFS